MSKKDYELIAGVIRAGLVTMKGSFKEQVGIEFLAIQLASAFAGDNPRFSRERFLKACGDVKPAA